MNALGVVMMIVGALTSLGSFLMRTSVHSESDYRFGTYTPPSDVVNIGLLQTQELVFLVGAALFVAGAVLFGSGAIVDQLRQHGRGAEEGEPVRAARSPVEPVATGQEQPILSPQHAHVEDQGGGLIAIVIAVVIGVAVLIATIVSFGGRSPTTSASVTNTEAIADNLETVADNMEAMADNMTARPR